MTRLTADWITSPSSMAVCTMLTNAGYQAWFVGGCVRNALLDMPVGDIDICTDAIPQVVMDLAKTAGLRAIPTGFDHGTVTILAHGQPVEVTTFRRDIATDGRHATVAFSTNIEEDAARRDFTMNALYASPTGDLADPVGGLPDLHARHVRFIGDPSERIAEDYLRILRFFRFTAIYGDPDLGIDAEGLAACASNLDGLKGLSRERVGAEIIKLLTAPDPAPAMAAMGACGALLRLLPGAGAQLLTVLVHVEQAAGLSPDPVRRLAALGGSDVADALRLSREQAHKLDRLKTAMDSDLPPGELGYRLGLPDARDALALRAALGGREVPPDQFALAQTGAMAIFPIKADDLMPALTGPTLGAALREAEDLWIASGFTLEKSDLIRNFG